MKNAEYEKSQKAYSKSLNPLNLNHIKTTPNPELQNLKSKNQELRQKLKMKNLNLTIIRNDIKQIISDQKNQTLATLDLKQDLQAKLETLQLQKEVQDQLVVNHKSDSRHSDRQSNLLQVKFKHSQGKLKVLGKRAQALRHQIMELESVYEPRIEAMKEELTNQKAQIDSLQQQFEKTDQGNDILK